MCDLTVSTDTALFGEVEIKHGWGPPLFITPFVVGLKAAKEILLLGETLDVNAALRLGLVNRVVPLDEFDAAVQTVCERLAGLKHTRPWSATSG